MTALANVIYNTNELKRPNATTYSLFSAEDMQHPASSASGIPLHV
jgi:hypothetical protein